MSQPAEAVSTEITQLHRYVNGEHVAGTSGRFGDVFSPSRGVKISDTPLASQSEVEAAMPLGSRIMITLPSPRIVLPENIAISRSKGVTGFTTISSVSKTRSTTIPNV